MPHKARALAVSERNPKLSRTLIRTPVAVSEPSTSNVRSIGSRPSLPGWSGPSAATKRRISRWWTSSYWSPRRSRVMLGELGLELVPVGRAVLRADRSDAEDVDDPGPPVRPAVRRGPGRTPRPRDPPGRRDARLGGWRLGREDVALQDRQPADRQQRAEGREELEGVIADDLDLPARRPFRPGANLAPGVPRSTGGARRDNG